MIPSPAPDFAKLVPGFDFLQGLAKNAGSVLPGMGQWVAPTLNPEELEKRIEELKTVQFWLEQNGRMLAATIQALEVQRMTLSTLQTMNVQMGDLRESMRIKVPGEATALAAEPEAKTGIETGQPAGSSPRSRKAKAAPTAVVDPMQWWGALTQQFTQLAANAMKEAKADGAVAPASRAAPQATPATPRTPAPKAAATKRKPTAGRSRRAPAKA